MKAAVLALLVLITPSLAGAALAPMDFAFGMPLSLAGKGAVYRLAVPREVYEAVARDDLADIRVFNRAGAAVPHVLRRPEPPREAPEHSRALPFFPLYEGEPLPEQEGLSMRVEKSGGQTMIQVYADDATRQEGEKLSGYLIDAGQHPEPIHALEVAWEENRESFVLPVTLEASDDMARWAPLVPGTTFARLQYGGHEILRNRIRMPGTPAAYYRLTWPAGQDGIALTAVHAIRQRGKPEPDRQWISLVGQAGNGDAPRGVATFEYESPARLPVDRVRLRFAEQNTLVKATIYSRSGREAAWRKRFGGVLYHLAFDGTILVQDTASVRPSADRCWKVAVEEGAFSDPGTVPVMELGWLPHELLFVARGEGPFLLAYGSARIGEASQGSDAQGPLVQLMGGDNDELLQEAAVRSPQVLGGPDRLVPAPPPVPWKTWLLWGVLLAGVAVIAKMALSLGREMQRDEDGRR